MRIANLVFFLAWLAASTAFGQTAGVRGLTSAQLAVVVNDTDPSSVEVGEYYRTARAMPAANMVHVRLPLGLRNLSVAQFDQLKTQIDAQLTPQIQAVLMVWTTPYAVQCNALTAAYTLGLDSSLCSKTCAPSKPSPYFNSASVLPYTDHGVRLSMLLPIESVSAAKALIDRGVASGFATPAATAYFLQTSDVARSSRAALFPRSTTVAPKRLTIKTMQADSLEQVDDIIVYETGLAHVPKLDSVHFLPGALADHLTSFGGDLLATNQMSSLRWLEAGATASYGTVSEPCNYWQKFPHGTVLLTHYLRGASAIEAYWKSVAWPAQGVFIGEPLAAPYRH